MSWHCYGSYSIFSHLSFHQSCVIKRCCHLETFSYPFETVFWLLATSWSTVHLHICWNSLFPYKYEGDQYHQLPCISPNHNTSWVFDSVQYVLRAELFSWSFSEIIFACMILDGEGACITEQDFYPLLHPFLHPLLHPRHRLCFPLQSCLALILIDFALNLLSTISNNMVLLVEATILTSADSFCRCKFLSNVGFLGTAVSEFDLAFSNGSLFSSSGPLVSDHRLIVALAPVLEPPTSEAIF